MDASQQELSENSCFTFLGTHDQNASQNMLNIIPISYLHKNITDCNENLAWGKSEPLIHPYVFWYKTKGEKVAKTSFSFLFTW